VGDDTAAPFLVTEIAEAAFANLRAASISYPIDRAVAKLPLNVSPAPVVSIASTLKPSTI